jgi:thioredoxin reductase (NADPH)
MPIVVCPQGELLYNPGEYELARRIGLVAPIDPAHLRRGRCWRGTRGIGCGGLRSLGRSFHAGARLPRQRRSSRHFGEDRKLSWLPMGISGAALTARAYNQAHKFRVEIAIPDEVTRTYLKIV